VNNAAVNVWGKRQNSSVESVPSRAKPQRRRRRRRPISSGDSTAGVTADKTPSPEAQYIHQTLSYTRTNKSPQDNKETARSSKNRSSTLETSNLPNLIVQISQHSSFDRDLYIAYQSSLSTQGTLPSVPEHPDSGLGESFSESDTPSPGPFEKDCIIPDSQSLPGSSSYIPTSNSSGSIAYVGKTPPSLGPYKSAPSQPNTPSKFESPNRELLQVDDSIDSSLLEIAASPSSVDIARRPASEPAPSSADNSSSSPFAARVPSLSRSTSDPTSIHYHDHRQQQQFQDHQKRVNHASDNQIDHNLLVQGSHISTSPTQAQAENNKQSKRFAIIQVPDSAESSSKSRQSPRAESLDQSLIFQTQVPLAFASRGSRVPIASAGMFTQPTSRRSCRIRD